MLAVDVRVDVRKMVQGVEHLVYKQLPFALARALTNTVKSAQADIREEMQHVFDRPTRFTLNGTYIVPARKNDLAAEVRVKDDALKNAVVREASRGNKPLGWLYPEVEGGERLPKASERLLRRAQVIGPDMWIVPGSGAKLDQYGNISRGEMQRILAITQSARDSAQRTTARSRHRNRAIRQYFLVRSPGKGALKPGVYRREGAGVKPVLLFVRAPRYRKRLDFYGVAYKAFKREFEYEFFNSMVKAISTARA